MIASTSCGVKTKIGMSGWPETMPSASDFGEVLDRVFAGQRAERRRLRMRTVAFLADGVAARAVLLDQDFALGRQILLRRLA